MIVFSSWRKWAGRRLLRVGDAERQLYFRSRDRDDACALRALAGRALRGAQLRAPAMRRGRDWRITSGVQRPTELRVSGHLALRSPLVSQRFHFLPARRIPLPDRWLQLRNTEMLLHSHGGDRIMLRAAVTVISIGQFPASFPQSTVCILYGVSPLQPRSIIAKVYPHPLA